MAEDNRVEVEFGANTDELKDKVQEASDVVKSGMGGIADSVKPAEIATVALGVAFADLAQKIIAEVGNAIKQSVMAFANLGDTLDHMSHRLGGSGENLSKLKMGLESVGISTTQYESIAMRMSMIIEQNGEKFEKAGIKIKDTSTGALLPMDQIIQNLMTHMNQFADGSAKNTEAAAIGLGRSWRMMVDLVEMTPERMKEASEAAEQFGLVLTQQDIDAADEFGRQTRLLQMSLQGFYVTIGKALDPALTKLAIVIRQEIAPAFSAFRDFMANFGADIFVTAVDAMISVLVTLKEVVVSVGSFLVDMFMAVWNSLRLAFGMETMSAMEFFGNVLRVLQILVVGFGNGITVMGAIVSGVFLSLSAAMKMFGEVSYAALRLDWEGAKAAWRRGTAEINRINDEALRKMVESSAKAREEMNRTALGLPKMPTAPAGSGATGTPPTPKPTTPTSSGTKTESDNRMALWRTELRDKLVDEGEFFKESIKQEIAFWEQKLALLNKNSDKDKKLYADLRSVLFELKKKEAQEQLALDIDALKRQSEAYRQGSVERIRIAGETAAMIGAVYGLESKEYRKALDDMTAAARERQEEQAKLDAIARDRVVEHNLSELDMERAHLDELRALGQIKQVDQLMQLRNLKEREYQILVQAKRDEIALMEVGSVAQAEAYARLEAMADAHALEMQRIAMNIGEAERAAIDKWLSPITEAFSKTVDGIIQGTLTLEDGFKNMCQSIVLEFQKMCLDIIKEWLKAQIQMQIQQNFASGGGGFFGSMLSGLMGVGGGGGGAGSFLVDGVPNGLTAAEFLPPLLDSGTGYVPRDMLAVIHKGEAVIPAEMNRAGRLGGMSVVNNFTVSGSVDTRTQRQIGMMAAQALTAAQMRNG